MSAKSWLTAHGGLVAAYDVQESAGTSLADFSGNSLTATTSTRGAVGGAAILTEEARSLTLTGLAGTGSAATRAVAGGSPLQLQTFTLVAFLKPSTATPTGSNRGAAGGRNNNWQIRWNTTGTTTGFVWIGGSPLTLTGVTAMPTTQTSMAALTYDGHMAELSLNAVSENVKFAEGTITNTTDALDLWVSGNNAFDGLGGLIAILNHKLELGDLRALLLEGASSLDLTTTAPVDYVADSVPVVAAAAAGGICGPCSGRLRANERRVVISTQTDHAECHAFRRIIGPVNTIDSSSTQAKYATRAEQFVRTALNFFSRRPTTGKGIYHDGVKWRSALNDVNAYAYIDTTGMGVAAAVVARHRGHYARGPLVEHARRDAALLTNAIIAPGYLPGDDFSVGNLGQLTVFLKDVIPDSEWETLAEQFLTTAEVLYSGATDVNGGLHGAQYGYYINGNREAGELIAYQCAALVSGSATWTTRVQNQLTFMIGPTLNNVPALNGGSSNGWKQASGSGSTGKGFFREAGGNGFYQATNAANFVDGYDPNYSHLCLQYLLRYFLLSGDAAVLPYINGIHNQILDNTNTTTWVLDGLLGSRQHNVQPFYVPSLHVITWRGDRSLSTTDMAAQYLVAESELRGLMPSGSQSTYREIGMTMGSLIMATDAWPGV